MTVSRGLIEPAFDALPARIAILATDGEIVHTNRSWQQFGAENDRIGPRDDVGTNYFEVCGAAQDDVADEACEGIRAVAAGHRDQFVTEYPCHSPNQERWFSLRAVPMERDGERYVLVMHVDVTERHRMEMALREQNDRLESVATLLSHDLRNPLTVAIGLAADLADGSEAGETLRSALHRMDSIVQDGLLLARSNEVSSTNLIHLGTAVDRAWSHVETANARVEVVDGLSLRADTDLLAHLLENLFRNAVVHAGEAPTVRVGALDRDPEGDGDGTDGPPAGFYVEDDGTGFDEVDAVFESGYTTASEGSGFGLAIVRRVAEAHGWTVRACAGTDGGARVEVSGVTVVPERADEATGRAT